MAGLACTVRRYVAACSVYVDRRGYCMEGHQGFAVSATSATPRKTNTRTKHRSIRAYFAILNRPPQHPLPSGFRIQHHLERASSFGSRLRFPHFRQTTSRVFL